MDDVLPTGLEAFGRYARGESIMTLRPRVAAIACALVILCSCGLFDSGVEWRGGPYELMWIDLPDNVSLVYRTGNDSAVGIVEPTVFSVGWNGRYTVVKQHPKGNKNLTNYFIVDDTTRALPLHPERALIGPLTREQFEEKGRSMQLPGFTKVLASLE